MQPHAVVPQFANPALPVDPDLPEPRLAARLTVEALDYAPFAPLFALSDEALLARGARRIIVPANPGINYPCRVSLAYPRAGEELILANHRHLDLPTTPYRAEGPVFVRKNAPAFRWDGRFPEIIMQREMAVRAYDRAGIMLEAELAEKADLVALAGGWLARPDIAHVDIHSARRGCFFCRIRRAGEPAAGAGAMA